MSEPIVFISHHRVKPGRAEAMKALTAERWSAMETEKPRTLMNLSYMNEEATEVTFMHAFADMQAMQLHWREPTSGVVRHLSTSNRSGTRSTDRRMSRS